MINDTEFYIQQMRQMTSSDQLTRRIIALNQEAIVCLAHDQPSSSSSSSSSSHRLQSIFSNRNTKLDDDDSISNSIPIDDPLLDKSETPKLPLESINHINSLELYYKNDLFRKINPSILDKRMSSSSLLKFDSIKNPSALSALINVKGTDNPFASEYSFFVSISNLVWKGRLGSYCLEDLYSLFL